jgi:hypothetical protein
LELYLPPVEYFNTLPTCIKAAVGTVKASKEIPLHAMEALEGRVNLAPALSLLLY